MTKSKIISKMRRKSLFTMVGIGLALIVVGILLFFAFMPKTTKYMLANKNVFSVPYDKHKIDGFYKGKTYYLYDWFADNDNGRFYFAPVTDSDGNSGFIEVFIPKQYQDQCDAIIEQTWEYMESGDKSDLKLSISCKGYIKLQDAKSVQFWNEYCDMVHMSQEERNTMSNKMFVMVAPEDVYNIDTFSNMVIPVVVILGGIIVILVNIFGKPAKKVEKVMREKNISGEDLDADMAVAATYGSCMVGSKYILNTGVSPELHLIEDIVWIYPQAVSQINSATTYFATLFTRYRGCIKLPARTKDTAESICKAIHAQQPRALYGYVIENAQMYNGRFNELIDMVYNQAEVTEEIADDTVSESVTETEAPQDPSETL